VGGAGLSGRSGIIGWWKKELARGGEELAELIFLLVLIAVSLSSTEISRYELGNNRVLGGIKKDECSALSRARVNALVLSSLL
jgi:hypothetical protein